ADAVHQPVMNSTERDRELVAGLATKNPWLHVPKMMRVRRLAAAYEAGLLGDIAKTPGERARAPKHAREFPPRHWKRSCRRSAPLRSAGGAARFQTVEGARHSQRSARISFPPSKGGAGKANRLIS